MLIRQRSLLVCPYLGFLLCFPTTASLGSRRSDLTFGACVALLACVGWLTFLTCVFASRWYPALVPACVYQPIASLCNIRVPVVPGPLWISASQHVATPALTILFLEDRQSIITFNTCMNINLCSHSGASAAEISAATLHQ